MKNAIGIITKAERSGFEPNLAPNHRRVAIVGWLFMFGLLAYTLGAQAKAGGMPESPAPWMPQSVQAIDPYLPDSGFNNGHFVLDHFQGPNGADEVGGFAARLSNGDIVVAGLVPDFGTVGTCGDGTNVCSIGLVRYSPAGLRQTWVDPGSYGHFQDQYVIYGEIISGHHTIRYIRDVKISNGIIYVLVDVNDIYGNRGNVAIYAFAEAGQPLYNQTIFGSAEPIYQGDPQQFTGAQMVFVSQSRLIVAATASPNNGDPTFLSIARLTVNGQQLVVDPAWGQAYQGGPNRSVNFHAPTSPFCATNASCSSYATYAVKAEGSASTDIYVGGSYQFSGNDWNVFVLKISSETGAIKPEFSPTGWRSLSFNQPGSTLNDRAAGLYVDQDNVYVAAQVAQKCNPGIGIAKLSNSTGALDTLFGTNGKNVFGGDAGHPYCYGYFNDEVPIAMSITGGRIGIVGYRHFTNQYLVGLYDPTLAVVDASNGAILDFDTLPVTRADGTRYGDAVLSSVFSDPGSNSFIVAGNGRDAANSNTLSYITGIFVPSSADRIFGNGFD